MKLRMFTGVALALALGGCASYGYVGDGGGYYTGGSSTRYVSDYGGYGGYGYGVYGYGSPYYSYRYNPGWSYGVRYGYPYSYYPGNAYRPPYYPRPPHHNYPRPPRPDHDGRPGHDGRPDRPPPVADGNPPPLNRGPWRDIERLRRGQGGEGMPRRQPGPGTLSVGDGSSPVPDPGLRSGNYVRPAPPQGYRAAAPRYSTAGNENAGAARPAPRSERSMERSEPRVSESRRSERSRSGTPDTIEP